MRGCKIKEIIWIKDKLDKLDKFNRTDKNENENNYLVHQKYFLERKLFSYEKYSKLI